MNLFCFPYTFRIISVFFFFIIKYGGFWQLCNGMIIIKQVSHIIMIPLQYVYLSVLCIKWPCNIVYKLYYTIWVNYIWTQQGRKLPLGTRKQNFRLLFEKINWLSLKLINITLELNKYNIFYHNISIIITDWYRAF